MYKNDDKKRDFDENEESLGWRSEFRLDYGRLIHSPSFRRLQGKTQLYPGVESDFFRNRLTHSLEVAQIAKSIAEFVNYTFLNSAENKIDPDICELAGLAHDLGHPPFGHQGEEALDDCMRNYGGFEGNAQTLRVLSKVEKKACDEKIKDKKAGKEYRHGLNFSYRSLASILKYDRVIPLKSEEREINNRNKPIKGYYASEKALVDRIKKHLVWEKFKPSPDAKFKTIECRIMDLADDIAYSTYDLEDGFKAGFYHPTNFFSYPDLVFENVASKVSKIIRKEFDMKEVKMELFDTFKSVYYDSPLTRLDEVEDPDHQQYYVLKKEAVPFDYSRYCKYQHKCIKRFGTKWILSERFHFTVNKHCH